MKDLSLPQSLLAGPVRTTPTQGKKNKIWAFIVLSAKVLRMKLSDWLFVMRESRNRLLRCSRKFKIRKQAKKYLVSEY